MSREPVRFSVVTTVFDPEAEHLAECLSSVDRQSYFRWEHVVVDDASTSPAVEHILASTDDLRRRVIRRARNGGIVAAGNDALREATGEWIVLLDHDDVLTDDALRRLAHAIAEAETRVDVVYSDHDILRPDGRCASPVYKPDFSPLRLRNHNYVTHLVAIRRTAAVAVGGYRPGTDGAQDHDLLLRLAESGRPFLHVPRVLLHWRQSPASVATDPGNKPAAGARQREAVARHLRRIGRPAAVEVGSHPGVVRLRRRVEDRPLVSIVVPTRGSRGRVWGTERVFVHDALSSILTRPSACDFEVIAVIDRDTDHLVERGLRQIAGDRLVVVEYDDPFNFSDKINRGVAASSGAYVLLLNDDTEMITERGVDELVAIASEDGIGMVGAKLLYEDGTLQHGGHVYNGTISHAMLGWPGTHPGPNRLLVVERECAGVTAAVALVSRSVFDDVGGMNTDLAVNYNDVDFSLRVRRSGRRVIWTPHSVWFHFEQRSGSHPIDPEEITTIRNLWGSELDVDPYYNPNLAPGRTDWLELPLASGAPPYEVLADGRIVWS